MFHSETLHWLGLKQERLVGKLSSRVQTNILIIDFKLPQTNREAF